MRKFYCLDLFCGAGGAAVGYHRAGFEVCGVDNKIQKHYPFNFYQYDAIDFLDMLIWGVDMFSVCGFEHNFDFIHASPPCQGYSWSVRPENKIRFPKLIRILRDRLQATGLPYVIENVYGARKHMIRPVLLCGTMFGLNTRRHRLFEIHPDLFFLTPHCNHPRRTVHITGSQKFKGSALPDWSLDERKSAIGIDWMTDREIAEAIPPAFTEFIGRHVLDFISSPGYRLV